MRRYRERYPEKMKAYSAKYAQRRRERLGTKPKRTKEEAKLRREMLNRASIADRLVRGAFRRAKKSGHLFALPVGWGKKNWTGRCAVTGIQFVNGPWQARSPLSPSIDRIDSALGYVEGNCRFVLWGINAMRCSSSDDGAVLMIATAIVANAAKLKLNERREAPESQSKDTDERAQIPPEQGLRT